MRHCFEIFQAAGGVCVRRGGRLLGVSFATVLGQNDRPSNLSFFVVDFDTRALHRFAVRADEGRERGVSRGENGCRGVLAPTTQMAATSLHFPVEPGCSRCARILPEQKISHRPNHRTSSSSSSSPVAKKPGRGSASVRPAAFASTSQCTRFPVRVFAPTGDSPCVDATNIQSVVHLAHVVSIWRNANSFRPLRCSRREPQRILVSQIASPRITNRGGAHGILWSVVSKPAAGRYPTQGHARDGVDNEHTSTSSALRHGPHVRMTFALNKPVLLAAKPLS